MTGLVPVWRRENRVGRREVRVLRREKKGVEKKNCTLGPPYVIAHGRSHMQYFLRGIVAPISLVRA